jgi:hypothetical protein
MPLSELKSESPLELVKWLIQHGCACEAHIYDCALAWKKPKIKEWFEKKEVMGDYLRIHNYLRLPSSVRDELLGHTVTLEELTTRGAFD